MENRALQFRIIRKHALAEWRSCANRSELDVDKVARAAHAEIRARLGPIAIIYTVVQIILLAAWLFNILWPNREPGDDDTDDVEAMGSMGI